MFAKKLKDPVSALSHLLGAILAIVATIILLMAVHQPLERLGMAVFGATLICLYAASTIYHALDISAKVNLILRKIDHAMIYVLIAGTYTPICLIALKGAWGTYLLITIWAIALAGIALTLLWFEAPRRLTTIIYVLMGWLAVVATLPLQQAIGWVGLAWLLGGGIFYTVGAVIYATKRPRITFPLVGFHEIFHIFVLAGSFCHFILMLKHLPY